MQKSSWLPWLSGATLPLAAAALFTVGCADSLTSPRPRAAAPQHLVACEDWTCDPGTGGGYPNMTGGLAVPGYASSTDCFSGVDTDQDGVSDGCELAVATAFAPLMYHSGEEWDYEPARGLVGGEYYWAVTKFTSPTPPYSGLRIAYLPAYYFDLGTGTFTDNFGTGGHDGDSEFLMVEVASTGQNWVFQRAFLSAHCGSTIPLLGWGQAPDCQWWNADMWGDYADNVYHGAPAVWSSRRKHALYFSYAKCQNADWVEGCRGLYVPTRFPVTPGFNMGSSAVLANAYVAGRRGSPWTSSGAYELLWTGDGFHGWRPAPYSGGEPPTLYGSILREFGF